MSLILTAKADNKKAQRLNNFFPADFCGRQGSSRKILTVVPEWSFSDNVENFIKRDFI